MGGVVVLIRIGGLQTYVTRFGRRVSSRLGLLSTWNYEMDLSDRKQTGVREPREIGRRNGVAKDGIHKSRGRQILSFRITNLHNLA